MLLLLISIISSFHASFKRYFCFAGPNSKVHLETKKAVTDEECEKKCKDTFYLSLSTR